MNMGIEIGTASVKDQETVFLALFGSHERYLESPGYKECKARIDYLANLKAIAVMELDDSYQKLRWWKLYSHAEFYLGKKIFFPMFYNRIDQLISRYNKIIVFPVGPAVVYQRRFFDQFMKDWGKAIVLFNKNQNVKDDPYVKPY
jgi:hypothetical protein